MSKPSRNAWATLVALSMPALLLAHGTTPDHHHLRFEFSKAFITNTWKYPIQDLEVSLECPLEASNMSQAGPVHNPSNDCEIHVGAALMDPSIGDFLFTVLEPPNVCKDPNGNWRNRLNALQGKRCTARGVIRVWPEHLGISEHCSNPGHVMEVHPLLKLACDGVQPIDFADKLFVPSDLGYKSPQTVRNMLDFRLWICDGCTGAGEIPSVGFDFMVEGGHVSNFGRLKLRIMPEFIRQPKTSAGASRGFATVIAKARALKTNGQADTSQWKTVKIVAVEGTAFFNHLMARVGTTGPGQEFDIVGIFTIDPLSVIKVLEKPETPEGEWVEVPYPVSFIAFGER